MQPRSYTSYSKALMLTLRRRCVQCMHTVSIVESAHLSTWDCQTSHHMSSLHDELSTSTRHQLAKHFPAKDRYMA